MTESIPSLIERLRRRLPHNCSGGSMTHPPIMDEMVERGRDYGGCDFTHDGSCAAIIANACVCGTRGYQIARIIRRRAALEAALNGKEE